MHGSLRRRWRRSRLAMGAAVLAPIALGAASTALASSSAPTIFKWSGATPASPNASNWSNGTNWVGGVAPAGTVGALVFPKLSNPTCATVNPTQACYSGYNNIIGLVVHALAINDGTGYDGSNGMQGNPMGLGAGGIKAAGTNNTGSGSFQLGVPLTLTAAQTWTIDGHGSGDQVVLTGNVAGSAHALTIDLNHQTLLDVSSDIEVGPITISTTQTSGVNNSRVSLAPGCGKVCGVGSLNATDGNPIRLIGPGTGIFVPDTATVGPLIADAGTLQLGYEAYAVVNLSVNGGFTQGSPNELALNVVNAGTVAGTDYSQLSATGPISLAGTLVLNGSRTGAGRCPTLQTGDVDTLLSTTGTLSGTFTGIPNGATVSINCSEGTRPTGTINYTANSVTLTVVTPGGSPTVGRNARWTRERPTPSA